TTAKNGNQPQTHINQGCSFPDELRTWSGENRESGGQTENERREKREIQAGGERVVKDVKLAQTL
ncbi:MAG: hypothetical protein PWR24_1012, partial [Desulfonauticus sp.]|nr:hypothetical protein [Desulfonauticus sp.]